MHWSSFLFYPMKIFSFATSLFVSLSHTHCDSLFNTHISWLSHKMCPSRSTCCFARRLFISGWPSLSRPLHACLAAPCFLSRLRRRRRHRPGFTSSLITQPVLREETFLRALNIRVQWHRENETRMMRMGVLLRMSENSFYRGSDQNEGELWPPLCENHRLALQSVISHWKIKSLILLCLMHVLLIASRIKKVLNKSEIPNSIS